MSLEKLRAFAINVAGAALMAVWEISRRIRGKWRRSALREQINQWWLQ